MSQDEYAGLPVFGTCYGGGGSRTRERKIHMDIRTEDFGVWEGRTAKLFTIDGANITLKVTDYGAAIVSILAPDSRGQMADVVCGYGDVTGYAKGGGCVGATVGPCANRTAGAEFTIDGTSYHMLVNENDNNLHTDRKNGAHKRFWESEIIGESVRFTLSLKDGEYGMPGNRTMCVTFSIAEGNAVKIVYHCTSDKKTVFNPTNHSYFNLAGEDSGSAMNQMIQIFADSFTPVRADSIPTGEIRPVAGTPMDFNEPRPIGQFIDSDYEQLKFTGGYDHNYVIRGYRGDGLFVLAARADDTDSGRMMEVYTTLPGVQFYSGNTLKTPVSKNGRGYVPRDGFCLETQYFPDSMHHDAFIKPVFGPDKPYDATTVYRFSVS